MVNLPVFYLCILLKNNIGKIYKTKVSINKNYCYFYDINGIVKSG